MNDLQDNYCFKNCPTHSKIPLGCSFCRLWSSGICYLSEHHATIFLYFALGRQGFGTGFMEKTLYIRPLTPSSPTQRNQSFPFPPSSRLHTKHPAITSIHLFSMQESICFLQPTYPNSLKNSVRYLKYYLANHKSILACSISLATKPCKYHS